MVNIRVGSISKDVVASLEAGGIFTKQSLDEIRDSLRELDLSKQKAQSKSILLELLKRALGLGNINLLMVIIEKLGFHELLELCKATIDAGLEQPLDEHQRRELVFFYTSSYLNITRIGQLDLRASVKRLAKAKNPLERNLFDLEQVLELACDCNQWDLALELSDIYYESVEPLNLLTRRRIQHKRGQSYEACDNYQRALVSFKAAACLEKHAIRLIIKDNVGQVQSQLKYQVEQIGRQDIQRMWLECSFACGIHSDNYSASIHRNNNNNNDDDDDAEMTFDHLIKFTPEAVERHTFSQLPEQIKVFLENDDASKWQDRLMVMSVSELSSNMSGKMRRRLAKIASRLHGQSHQIDMQKLCSIYKTLNEPELSFELLPKTMSSKATATNDSYLRALNDFASSDQIATSMCNLLLSKQYQQTRTLKEDQLLSVIYLKLGLLDEALRLSLSLIRGEQDIWPLVAHLELLANGGEPATASRQLGLDELDPDLCSSTLEVARQVLESIQMDSQQQLAATNVIVYVISCQVIFLHKLDTLTSSGEAEGAIAGSNLAPDLLAKLELMFEHLAVLLKQFDFAVSDGLLRVTNELVKVVKFKLDLLAACDCIRNTLGQLVESTASKCLMAAKYKQAAVLYSHIDDNMSAAKALMRTGDLEVVTNFALLVNDIAVNRITINYLKHLGAAETIQRDFISKSSMSQQQSSQY